MTSAATIVRAGICRNRSTQFARAFPAILVVLSLIGCAPSSLAPSVVPTWELANAEPFEPIRIGRARVSFDRPLPPHLVQELSPEFSLITIRDRTDWSNLQRRLRLPAPPPAVDLSQGVIVGILARVGESADGSWPIHLRYVRCRGGEGSVEATFTAGLYYPLLTASYLELAFAPTLRTVSMVKINHRRFLIRSTANLH